MWVPLRPICLAGLRKGLCLGLSFMSTWEIQDPRLSSWNRKGGMWPGQGPLIILKRQASIWGLSGQCAESWRPFLGKSAT